MNSNVKNKPTGRTRQTRKRDGRVKVTSQGQVSIPRQIMREAGVKPGDRLQASTDEHGRIVLEPIEDPLIALLGSMPGAFDRAEMEKIRKEWDRSF